MSVSPDDSRNSKRQPHLDVVHTSGGERSLVEHEQRVFSQLSVDDENKLADGRLRRSLAWPIVSFFGVVNLLVAVGVGVAFHYDTLFIREHVISPSQRLITPATVQTMIGATTVQLGAICYTLLARLAAPLKNDQSVSEDISE